MEAQMQLVRLAARHVHYFLDHAMNFECNGCSVDHPSQLQHECLMLDGEDRIRFCLDQALLLVDWGQVKHEFEKSCPRVCSHGKEWFQTLWADVSWYDQLVSALLIYKYQHKLFHLHFPDSSHHECCP